MSKRRGRQSDKSFKRQRQKKLAHDIIFVFCESSETEPNYLGWLKSKHRLRYLNIERSKGHGTDPKELIKHAFKTIEHKGLDKKDVKVWLVFDCDRRDYIDECIRKAHKQKCYLAISNPCIELWFFLHFDYTTAHLNPDEAMLKIKEHINDYDKTSDSFFPVLYERFNKACGHAEALRQYHYDNDESEYSNPSTHIDNLITSLLEGAKKG